ncbi:MAG: altronate dehydratase, partial [Clostridia bacterium]
TDFDTSGVITGEDSVENLGIDLMNMLLDVANRKKTKAEIFKMNEVGFARLCNYV